MTRATEDTLAQLHGKVAKTMIAALDQADRASSLLMKYSVTEEGLPDDVRRFLEDACEVNPSLLTSATKFLKDNNISCDPAEDEDLAELQNRLKEKKRSNVTSIPLKD